MNFSIFILCLTTLYVIHLYSQYEIFNDFDRYYSMYGHVERLAEEIKKGADSVQGVEATLWQACILISLFFSVSVWIDLFEFTC